MRPMGTAAYGGKGQGKGKGRGEGRLGQGGRGRSKGGEKPMGTTAYGGKGSKGRAANGDRPVGAASCRRDHHTMASCQNPPGQLAGAKNNCSSGGHVPCQGIKLCTPICAGAFIFPVFLGYTPRSKFSGIIPESLLLSQLFWTSRSKQHLSWQPL